MESDAGGEFELSGGFTAIRDVELVREGEDDGVRLYAVSVVVEWPPAGRVELRGKRAVVELE